MEKSPSEWLQEYKKSLPEFEWIFKEYYPQTLDLINKTLNDPNVADDRKASYIRTILSDVWFALPDDKFNIKVNPKGWKPFLNLLDS